MNPKQRFSARFSVSPLWKSWQRLQPREQMSLTLLGVFLLLALYYLLLWKPFVQRVRNAQDYYHQERELYIYIEQNAELARKQLSGKRAKLTSEQLQGFITQTAQQKQLRIEKLESVGDNSLLVILPSAPFRELLGWFMKLQDEGVTLAEVSLSNAGEGLVSARINVALDR